LLATNAPLTIANLFNNNLMIDNFTYFCQIFVLLNTASIIVICLNYFKDKNLNAFESIILILLSTHSMFLMISIDDLIAMYLTMELQSLCFYVIATLKRNFEFSIEANFDFRCIVLWNFIVSLFYDLWIYWSYQL
jgi:NADH-ubiquinone oxidoreductase chain 2